MMRINIQSMSVQMVLKSFLKNKTIRLLVCVTMGALVIVVLSAQAQDKGFVVAGSKDIAESIESTKVSRWALLVGIANYPSVEGFEIQQLKAPVKDVNALAAFLKDPQKGGFDADHVFTLTDEKATRRNILITFNEIARRAEPDDMVIFYFSGHGTRHSKRGTTYLIPYDHDLRDLETTCIDFDDLAAKIRDMEASKVVVILDACHSGGVKPKGAKAAEYTGLVKRYLETFQRSEGRALLLSSDESEVSWETEQYGIFTHFLLEGIEGKADKNEDGIVTFTEVALYVEDAVQKHTRENFPRVQKPTRRYELGMVRGEIPLAINWDKVHRQRQQELLDKRNAAVFRASLAGLDQTLKEFSLRVAQSAYRKALNDEPLEEQEALLLQEMDALKNGAITAVDYITRARAIYNLTLAQLRIAVTPADARVTLAPADAPGSVVSPASPNVYQIDRGRYSLSIEKSGYAAYSRELNLDQANEEVTVALERLTGILQLQVEPADATVMVMPLSIAAPDAEIRESEAISVQPVGERSLPIGTYRVAAEREGYDPAAKELVEIKANTSTQVTLALKPSLATIAATNLPDGTRVFVNGTLVALPHKLPSGRHRIRLECDGFKPVEMSETLESAQVLPLRPIWSPITGTLQLQVEPADATVMVTPLSIAAPDAEIRESKAFSVRPVGERNLPVGTYRVAAEKEGYERVIKEPVEIKANISTQVTLALKPMKPGLATIVAPDLPVGTRILVNGESVALPYELPPGTHRIRLERDGFQPVEMSEALKAARVLTLRPRWSPITGTLQLQVEPADAKVVVTPLSITVPDTEIKGLEVTHVQSTSWRKLPIGTYRVTAEKEGYESAIKESVKIKADQITRVTLALDLERATVVAPDLPDDTVVLVNGESVALPHKLPPGTYAIRLERDGFQPVEISETLKSAQVLPLRPEWIPITSPEIIPPAAPGRGIPRVGAFAASLIVPGLGQHLQRHHVRGAFYEVMAIGAGAAVVLTTLNYQGRLDDLDRYYYSEDAEDYYEDAEFARNLAIASQIVLGVVWGINALDAGIVKPEQQSDGIAFEVHPTSDGGRVLVRAPF